MPTSRAMPTAWPSWPGSAATWTKRSPAWTAPMPSGARSATTPCWPLACSTRPWCCTKPATRRGPPGCWRSRCACAAPTSAATMEWWAPPCDWRAKSTPRGATMPRHWPSSRPRTPRPGHWPGWTTLPPCRQPIPRCARSPGARRPRPLHCAAAARGAKNPWHCSPRWNSRWRWPAPRGAWWCARCGTGGSAATRCLRRRPRTPDGSGGAASVERQLLLRRLDASLAAHDALELGATDRDVALVAADLHLRPVLHRAALLVHAHGHRRLAAAVADGLDLLDLVGPGQQVAAALEQFAAEVGAQAVAQHRHAAGIHDLGQLPDLRPAQELGLVHQHAVQPALCADVGLDDGL